VITWIHSEIDWIQEGKEEREELEASVLLMDELAAREVAKRRNHIVTGFPGVVYFAVKYNRITPEDARELLYICQRAGTYYAIRFIEGLYLEMKEMVS
jgi:predicted nucleic acid-binding protein